MALKSATSRQCSWVVARQLRGRVFQRGATVLRRDSEHLCFQIRSDALGVPGARTEWHPATGGSASRRQVVRRGIVWMHLSGSELPFEMHSAY